MGEQLSDGGTADRRRAHPGATPSGPQEPDTVPGLEALLAAAMRPAEVDAEGERRAVAAFRDARNAGALGARTRRRDDWRPRTRRRTVRSLRATLSLVAGSLALGGVAFAAIGSTGSAPDSAGGRTAAPSAVASHPGAASASGTAGHGPDDRPGTAKDTEAKCRAYEHKAGRGNALEATAWQRLVEAAGGADRVAAYCAERLAEAARGGPDAGAPAGRGKGDAPTAGATTGNGTTGNGSTGGGDTGGAAGNGNTGKGQEKTGKSD
ncbi:hypothetical protein [Streptomyces sp. NPDC003832]